MMFIQEPPDGTITKVCYRCMSYNVDDLIWSQSAGAYICKDARKCYQGMYNRYNREVNRHNQLVADLDRYNFYDE